MEPRQATLANAAADVLRAQTARSNGGLWYADPGEFHAALELLLAHPPLAETLGLQGRRWVRATASREGVRAQWLEALGAAARARQASDPRPAVR